MAELTDFVTINIAKETAVLSQTGFGTELVLGDGDVLPATDVVTLTNDAETTSGDVYAAKLNGVALAGAGLTWATDNDTHITAVAAIIQARSEVATAVASDVGSVGYLNTITVTGETDEVLNFTEVSISGGSAPNVTVLKTQTLVRVREYANMTAVAVDFAATDQEYLAAQSTFSQNPRPTSVKIGRKNSAGETWVEALDAIVLEDDDWYVLAITTRTQSDVEAVQAWVETRIKLFGSASNDAGILTTGTSDIAYTTKSNGYERSFIMYSALADGSVTDEYPECAWFGRMLPKNPGSATWMFKALSSITPDILTATQIGNALGKNCNLYETVAAKGMTHEGVVGSGEYLDIVRGIDWLQARMGERIFGRLINTDKIPYTDPGIQMVGAEMKAQLEEGISYGLISLGYEVILPTAASVSAQVKGTRNLPSPEFIATLQGAIHEVVVNGKVTY